MERKREIDAFEQDSVLLVMTFLAQAESLNAFWEMNQTACTTVTAPLHPSVLSEALCTEISY